MGNKSTLCVRSSANKFNSDTIPSVPNSPGSTPYQSHLKKSFINGQLTKDNFKILKVIGRGSFGKVFLVEKKPDMHRSANFTHMSQSVAENKPQYYAMKVLRKSNLIQRN